VSQTGAAASETSPLVDPLSFVPRLVRETAVDAVPHVDRFQAVLLYADAASFSRLTASLVAEDRRGAVEVGRIVNAHFRRLVDLVDAHDGIVQGIAGDALIALWPCRDDAAGAQRQAEGCGREIAAGLGRVGDRPLPVRVVIDAGEVWLAHLGGAGERLAVAAGPLMEGMGELSAQWRDGAAIMTDAARRLTHSPAGRTMTARHGGAFSGGPGAAFVAEYVPPPVRGLLKAARPEWLAEFRKISVVFTRFAGWRSGVGDALPHLDRLAADCRTAVSDHGGAVLQFMVDDKGLILLACWGLPVNTTEDGEVRAVRAAEAIEAAARTAGLQPGVGVTTGKAFTGIVGGDGFRHYCAVGTVVNDAAFLMRQGQASIVCDAATRAGAEAVHRFDALGRLVSKGAGRAEEIFAPRGPREREETARDALIGRRDERERILAALTRSKGGLAWIAGEPGIGKSHLAHAMCRDLAARGIPCVSTTAESLDTGLPYGAWRPLVRKLLGRDAEATAEIMSDSRLSTIDDLAERLPLLGEVLGLAVEDSAAVAALPDTVRATETRRVLGDLIAALAPPGGYVLVIEDVHWLETGSWLLLDLLRSRLPRMAVLLTSRREAVGTIPDEVAALLREEDILHVPLDRLGATEAERLVHQTLAADNVPQEITRRIFARAEGHPYYTKALAASMLQRGLLQSRDGHCYLSADVADLSELEFPDTIQGAIAARLSILDPAAQLTLKVASVNGRVFRVEQVAAIHPDRPARETIDAHLAAAHAVELVEPGPAPDLVQFHHALARDTVYDLLVEEQRRVLHAAAARWHEAAEDEPSDRVLAHHLAEAGESRRAIVHLDRAAASAAAAQNPREAADLLQRAIQLDVMLDEPHPPHVVGHWHRRAGEALFEFGDPRKAMQHLKHAVVRLDVPFPRATALGPRLLAEFWRVKTRQMRRDTPSAEREGMIDAAGVYTRLAFFTYELQRHFEATYCTFRSLHLGKQAGGDSAVLAIANVNMAMASLALPFAIDGGRHRTAAFAMAERLDDPDCSLFVYWYGSSYDIAIGDFEAAIESIGRAITAGEMRRSPRDVEALRVSLANIYRVFGRHWLGLEDLELALASARDRGNLTYRIWALGQLCRSHFACGDLDSFRRCLAEYRPLMTDGDARGTASEFNRVVFATAEAQACLVDGDAAGALERVGEAAAIALTIPVPQFYFLEIPGMLGDALLWIWRMSAEAPLAACARRNVRLARRMARLYPAARSQAPLAQGDLAFLAGRPRVAVRNWRKAAEKAAGQGLIAQEGQALGRLALPGTDVDPAWARDRAAACFASLGGPMPYPLAQIIAPL
jgi:tetratricopeptide (TPR) repeat protein